MKNIVLIGLSGSGKTELGKAAAAAAGLAFRDMDEEIEKTAEMSVSEIFAAYGEEGLRDMESEEAGKASAMSGAVISTGGGAVLREGNMRLLSASGFVVFIDRPPELIAEDIECQCRPLLAEGAARLLGMSQERRPLYLKHAHTVLDNGGSFEQALEKLVLLINSEYPGKGFGVIGDPIGHTKSPEIHKAVFSLLGLGQGAAWDYKAIHVKRGRLREFIEAAKASGLRSFNVTIPHKQDIVELLDDIDEEARLCGAVNTVVAHGGRLKGYNTDMGGLYEAIKAEGAYYKGACVAVLGAGGAAAGVAFKAAREGAAKVRVLGRRREQALELVERVSRALAQKTAAAGHDIAAAAEISGMDMSPETLAAAMAGVDVLVNATPLGMEGAGDFENLDFLGALPQDALVCDLVYGASETALLKKARGLGIKGINGKGMLIYQALLADELYIGREIDKRPMFATISKMLDKPKQADL